MGKQKRSANTYQKINTIFKRDVNNIIMPYDGLVLPEFEWLRNCKFDASIKIDGTNMRIEVIPQINNGECALFGMVSIFTGIEVKGKTDNANIPPMLDDFMWNTYISSDGKKRDGNCELLKKIFKGFRLPETYMRTRDIETGLNIQENIDWMLERGYIKKCGCHTLGCKPFDDPDAIVVDDYCIDEDNCKLPKMFTIYGEGYGKKIGAAGCRYIKDGVSFRAFDIKVTNRDGSSIYLNKEQRNTILDEIGIPKVIDVGQFTIDEAIEYVKKGFPDPLAEDQTMMAEGLVLKTPDGLLRKNGERIIFKVKHQDFEKYLNKYGTLDKVEQIPNSNY